MNMNLNKNYDNRPKLSVASFKRSDYYIKEISNLALKVIVLVI